VDLIAVSVRVPTHRELVSAAVQAGKAVYCEWPLGNGLAETEEIARLAGEHDVPTIVGLQIRANPVMNYLRDLVADGYVGEVLSTTVIGSAGGNWGAYSDPNRRYVLDPVNGATLLTVPFSHALDGLAWVLGEPQRLHSQHTRRRRSVTEAETGERLGMTSPDQVVASGRLTGGAVASVHYRGGQFRGVNFHWEINGTEGDIVVTAPVGHIQLALCSEECSAQMRIAPVRKRGNCTKLSLSTFAWRCCWVRPLGCAFRRPSRFVSRTWISFVAWCSLSSNGHSVASSS
jgi:predicted dehydrogenase